MTDRITPQQFHESEGVEDWRVLGDGASTLFRTDSLAAAARLVQGISELGGVDDHQRSAGASISTTTRSGRHTAVLANGETDPFRTKDISLRRETE